MAKKVNDLCGMLLDLSVGNTLEIFLVPIRTKVSETCRK